MEIPRNHVVVAQACLIIIRCQNLYSSNGSGFYTYLLVYPIYKSLIPEKPKQYILTKVGDMSRSCCAATYVRHIAHSCLLTKAFVKIFMLINPVILSQKNLPCFDSLIAIG